MYDLSDTLRIGAIRSGRRNLEALEIRMVLVESAARGRLRASSAIFNPAGTFQLIITERFLVASSGVGRFQGFQPCFSLDR